MHIKGMMEHIDLQEEHKMNLEEENIISMTMTEMEISKMTGMIGILEMIGIGMIEMTGIGSKNHKGMSLRNPTRMSGMR
jgi:hypothetical protein